MTRAASLGDDALELVDLLLGTAEGTELLSCVSILFDVVFVHVSGSTYSLLGELTGTLVLAVSEQLNDSALVGGKAVKVVVSGTVA